MVLGFCIGEPFIWDVLLWAPDRIVAAALVQLGESRPEMRDLFYENNMKGPEWVKRRPTIAIEDDAITSIETTVDSKDSKGGVQ
jgi:hypothetical protein